MIRTLTTIAAATALLAAAGAAAAQDASPVAATPPASGKWTFSFDAATDNRSKDASKTQGDPFVGGAARWVSGSGFFYGGPSFQTIKSSGGSNLELAAAAGIRPEFAGFDFDLNTAYKYQVDSNPGVDEDAWEFTADLKRSIGPASGRLRLQHSPDGTGSTKEWTWVEAHVGWDFTNKLSGSAGIGRREQNNSVDYTGWDAGLAYALSRNVEASLHYYDTDADSTDKQYEGALVAGINISF